MRETQKAGFAVGEFCQLVGFGRSKLYLLPPEQQPKSVKVGERRIIIEQPADYLERLAAAQAEHASA